MLKWSILVSLLSRSLIQSCAIAACAPMHILPSTCEQELAHFEGARVLRLSGPEEVKEQRLFSNTRQNVATILANRQTHASSLDDSLQFWNLVNKHLTAPLTRKLDWHLTPPPLHFSSGGGASNLVFAHVDTSLVERDLSMPREICTRPRERDERCVESVVVAYSGYIPVQSDLFLLRSRYREYPWF